MALYKCSACGNEREARCKPRKCPKCEGKNTYNKVEAPAPKKE